MYRCAPTAPWISVGAFFLGFASKSFGHVACASRRFTKARQLRKAGRGIRRLARARAPDRGCTFEEVQNAVKHRGAAMGIPAQLQVH